MADSLEERDLDDVEALTVDPGAKRLKTSNPSVVFSCTIRKHTYVYFHLRISNGLQYSALDEVTIKARLDKTLDRYLGVTGLAMPVDILKADGEDIWLRVPREDAPQFHAALTGFMTETWTWQIVGRSPWLGSLAHTKGADIFEE